MSSTETDTRERILKETWHLMEKRRGQGVRIEDVAQAAGVSRQAVYLHFGSRAELLIATTHYLDDTLHGAQKLQEAVCAETAVGALEAYVEFWTKYIPQIYGLAKVLMTMRETDKAAAAAWDDRMEALYSGCLIIMQRLEKEGILSPELTVDEAADFFWATISIASWENLTIERGWSQEQFIERIQQALKRALLRDT
jgi:AcrR family transcriptional regulator